MKELESMYLLMISYFLELSKAEARIKELEKMLSDDSKHEKTASTEPKPINKPTPIQKQTALKDYTNTKDPPTSSIPPTHHSLNEESKSNLLIPPIMPPTSKSRNSIVDHIKMDTVESIK